MICSYFLEYFVIFFKFEINNNLRTQFKLSNVAVMISAITEFKLLDEKLTLTFPIQYSYKNGTGGFFRVGDESVSGLVTDSSGNVNYVKLIDQLYEPHIFNFGFEIGFDSKNLFGDYFQYQVTNKNYFSLSYLEGYLEGYPDPELFFYEILENNFIIHAYRYHQLRIFLNGGFGLAWNARTIHSDTDLIFAYDPETDSWDNMDDLYQYNGDTGEYQYNNDGIESLWSDRLTAHVISFDVGTVISIIENLDFGLSYSTPKLRLGVTNPIGTQQNYGTFKIWTELRF